MRILDKISDTLDKYSGMFLGIILLLVTLLLTINVIGRKCFGQSIAFGEEIATYTIIWITFVGSGICVKRGIHVSVDAFISFLPVTGKKIFIVFANLIGLAFSIGLFVIGIILCGHVAASGQLSPAMRIPMVIAYLAIPVGTFYMTLAYLRILLNMALHGIEIDEDDVDEVIEKSI